MLLVCKQSDLKQVEDHYKGELEKELSARKQVEKVFLSSKLFKCSEFDCFPFWHE